MILEHLRFCWWCLRKESFTQHQPAPWYGHCQHGVHTARLQTRLYFCWRAAQPPSQFFGCDCTLASNSNTNISSFFEICPYIRSKSLALVSGCDMYTTAASSRYHHISGVYIWGYFGILGPKDLTFGIVVRIGV